MVKCIVDRINHERNNKTDPAKKALEIITKDLMQLEKKKAKLFDAYENDVISMEDFRNRNDELNEKLTALHTQKSELDKDHKGEKLEYISFDLVKTTLKNFSLIMSSDITNQKQKKLLHMIISEITVNEKREVDSINIKLTDQLINYLKTEKGVSKSDTPAVFAQNSYIITNQEIKFSI
jgi:site-specific DNA recombinase